MTQVQEPTIKAILSGRVDKYEADGVTFIESVEIAPREVSLSFAQAEELKLGRLPADLDITDAAPAAKED